MKILVLTKRQYTGKDLIDDRFGRLRELPLELARLGHEVVGICLSYRQKDEGRVIDSDLAGRASVTWHSFNLGKLLSPGLHGYLRSIYKLAGDFRPDVVWAASDSFHVILGVRLSRYLKTKCVVDLYDNFESFAASRLPGVTRLFRKAVKAAAGVTCVSQALADKVTEDYQACGPVMVLSNAARADLFGPQNRVSCRKRLGLPESARIFGTAGALHRSRGIDTLFRAFKILTADNDGVHLAIAGARGRTWRFMRSPQIHDLGVLRFECVPLFLNALDVAVICNRDSPFGKHNFPQKAYEIIACRVPLVAAAVGAMKNLLRDHPECLFEPDNPESLVHAVRLQLRKPTAINLNVPTWTDAAKRLDKFLEEIVCTRDESSKTT